jgi:putative sterol carrier protein
VPAVRYLSPEWFDAAGKALGADDRLREATADVELVLEQTVTDGPDGTVRWRVVVDHGDVRLETGPAPDADLHFTTTYRVASAIAQGDMAAPQAFVAGDLAVTGDLALLSGQLRALGALDDALGDVRLATTFD